MDRLLRAKGRTPGWLARKLEVPSKQSVYDWIKGREPRDAAIWGQIAEALDVDPAALDEGAEPLKEEKSTRTGSRDPLQVVPLPTAPQLTLIPYWGTVPAGDWDRDAVEDGEMVQVSDRYKDVTGIRGVRVGGDSMSPRLSKGEIVIIKLSSEKHDGVITLFLNQHNELTLKILRHTPKGWMLLSANPDYDSVSADEVTILGYAIGREESDPFGLRA